MANMWLFHCLWVWRMLPGMCLRPGLCQPAVICAALARGLLPKENHRLWGELEQYGLMEPVLLVLLKPVWGLLQGHCCCLTAGWEEPCTQHAGTCGTSHMRFSYFLVWTSWGQEAILNSHFSEFKSLQLSFYCLTIAKVKSFSLIINPECAFLHMEDPDSLLLTAWYFFSVLSCTINHCTQLSTLGNQKTIFNVNLGKPALVKKHVVFFFSLLPNITKFKLMLSTYYYAGITYIMDKSHISFSVVIWYTLPHACATYYE